MKFEDAIKASDTNTATIEYGSLCTCIDGSALSGGFSISTGRQGMPVDDNKEAHDLNEAIAVVMAMDLDYDEWTPIGEDGEEQVNASI